jgi:antitoxin ParD1/3/4
MYNCTTKAPKDFYFMTRQSISLTDANNDWLLSQLATGEYTSKNEVLNDLIRRERRKEQAINEIRQALIAGEQSGFTKLSVADIRKEARAELNLDD